MIRVSFDRQGDRITGFEAEGHSGYADSGSDIVCAAVSALLVNCANAIEEVARVSPAVRENEEAGFLSLRLPDAQDEAAEHDAQVILASTEIGINGIAQQYPGFVRVSSRIRR